MSIYKKIFGYFLILFSLIFIVLIGFPQFYASNSSGRIDKEVYLDINFLKHETSQVVLLYFGYVGCKTICTPSMTELNEIYSQLNRSKVKVYFINLLDSSDKELPQLFAQYFNENFIGMYLDKKEIQELVNQMRITTTTSLSDSEELNHSGHLYVLVKDDKNSNYKQKYIYTTRPFDKSIIIEDINNLGL